MREVNVGLAARRYALFRFFETEVHPERVILSDDPLRVKMLAAHHLDNAALLHEKDDELLYFGSYNGTAAALAGVGFTSGAVLNFMREVCARGVTEVIYTGACSAVSDRYALRTVILADGGSRSLLNRALTAAARCAIPVAVRTVSPPGAMTGENVDIIDSITGAVYGQARADGVKALSVLTVAENVKTGEKMEEHELRSRFYAAARLVFETMALGELRTEN